MKKEFPTRRQKVEERGSSEDRQNTIWSREILSNCEHEWQPVSMVFETQLLDKSGRVRIRQPDLNNGRVYLVCLKCCAHTYMETGWAGYYIGSPDLLEEGLVSEDLSRMKAADE